MHVTNSNTPRELPKADPTLLAILDLAHQAQKSYSEWREHLPNDVFWKSRWKDIDDLDSKLMAIKCDIAELIGSHLVDHLD